MSLLFLYRRVFYPTHMRYTTLVLVGIVFAWLVASSTIEIGYPGHTIGAYFPGGAETVFVGHLQPHCDNALALARGVIIILSWPPVAMSAHV